MTLQREMLIEIRTKDCTHCNTTGKNAAMFDGICSKCTPPHCISCGAMAGLVEVPGAVDDYYLCTGCARKEERAS